MTVEYERDATYTYPNYPIGYRIKKFTLGPFGQWDVIWDGGEFIRVDSVKGDTLLNLYHNTETLEEYQLRVHDELLALNDKIARLKAYLLDKDSSKLLELQLSSMLTYSMVLTWRLEEFDNDR